MVYYL